MVEETTLLNDSVVWARQAAKGILNGSLKPAEGHVLLGAGRLMSNVAKQSVSNRMNRGRLLAQEARIVEASEGGEAA